MGECDQHTQFVSDSRGQGLLSFSYLPRSSHLGMQTYLGVKVGSNEAYISVTFSPVGLIVVLAFLVFLFGVWNLYRDGLLWSTFYLWLGRITTHGRVVFTPPRIENPSQRHAPGLHRRLWRPYLFNLYLAVAKDK